MTPFQDVVQQTAEWVLSDEREVNILFTDSLFHTCMSMGNHLTSMMEGVIVDSEPGAEKGNGK